MAGSLDIGRPATPTPSRRSRQFATLDSLHLDRPASSLAALATKPPFRLLPPLRFATRQFLSPHSNQPTERPRTTEPPDLNARPRHIPIVIPHYAQPVLSQSPDISPRTITSPRVSDFLLPGKGTTEPRPRYVEIKIPHWTGTKYLPPTPDSLEHPFKHDDDDQGRSSAPEQQQQLKVIPTRNSADDIGQHDSGWEEDRKDSTISNERMARPVQLNGRAGAFGSGGIPPLPYPENMNVPASYPSGPSGRSNSQPSLFRINTQDATPEAGPSVRTPASSFQNQSAGPSPAISQSATTTAANPSSNIGLSGFVCNVHRTTGREPKPLVGATTTIIGDSLYVFGGRRLSRTRPQLTADLYQLDLIRRHWTKIEARGDIPPPRYFHSVCALGDTKLVCYGGMSPATLPNGQPTNPSQPPNPQDPQPEIVVMSDIHIFDLSTRTWMRVPVTNSPQGRYAHCAAILPSSALFSSAYAPLSAISHNPSSSDSPNQGKIGVSVDGNGGAEMVVVGGQDSANHYIEQISVFNLRSLTWTSTSVLGRSCGAYRSVTAPLSASAASQIGIPPTRDGENTLASEPIPDGASAMLIYSNYNFLDVQLELQVRLPDGTLVEKPMQGTYSPPGLRFPNGGVIDGHFVVSGTFLTSSKQEYALWALDLRSLVWSRIDIGSSTFSQGSWNRGVLWSRRNAFVILGNRKRSLVEDYNHRRINFSNLCVIELEAFGLYDNPRRLSPMSGYISASAPRSALTSVALATSAESTDTAVSPGLDSSTDSFAGGRELSKAAEDLGRMALANVELADMDFLAMNGERIPVNSRLVSRRWGPYFSVLVREALVGEGNDTATLRASARSTAQSSRNSSITITPSLRSTGAESSASTAVASIRGSLGASNSYSPNSEATVQAAARPRVLFLPHYPLTIHALLHFLYTSSLPAPTSPLCTPQVLCSLLQIARPYKVDGLLEAVVERLHATLDNRNTAAIFNAAAMAAGGGDGVEFFRCEIEADKKGKRIMVPPPRSQSLLVGMRGGEERENGENGKVAVGSRDDSTSSTDRGNLPRLNTDVSASGQQSGRPETSHSMSGASASEDEFSSAGGRSEAKDSEVWSAGLSAVVGLQKRGLRGLMEGRRIREMGSRDTGTSAGSGERVGLGIG